MTPSTRGRPAKKTESPCFHGNKTSSFKTVVTGGSFSVSSDSMIHLNKSIKLMTRPMRQ